MQLAAALYLPTDYFCARVARLGGGVKLKRCQEHENRDYRRRTMIPSFHILGVEKRHCLIPNSPPFLIQPSHNGTLAFKNSTRMLEDTTVLEKKKKGRTPFAFDAK